MNEITKREIAFKLSLDPDYVKKSKKSICKDCANNLGFNDERYDCKIHRNVLVEYKREGVFHVQIIKCSGEIKKNE